MRAEQGETSFVAPGLPSETLPTDALERRKSDREGLLAMLREIVGACGALVVAASALYYLADVLCARTRPHQASWAVWAVIGLLGFGTASVGGAGPGAYAAAVDAVACIVTFAISLLPRFGKPGLRRSDVVLAVVAVAGVLVWRWGPLPTSAATLLAVGCALVALWPTLREARRRPSLECRLSWGADVLGNAMCVAASATASLPALAYPVYLLLACLAMTSVLAVPPSRETAANHQQVELAA
jgi:hypothetical protein